MLLKFCIVAVFMLLLLPLRGQEKLFYYERTPDYLSEKITYTGSIQLVTDRSAVPGVEISVEGYGIVGHSANDGSFSVEAPVNISGLSFRKEGLMGASVVFINDNDRRQSVQVIMFPEQVMDEEQQLILENYPISTTNEDSGELLKKESLLKSTARTEVPTTIRVLMSDNSVVVMSMDEYLKGVVPSEVPPSWNMNALKAQAVAARSYAAANFKHNSQGADVCTTTHCQAWKSTHYSKTDQAVTETSFMSVKYGGNIINALFFSHCNGHTRNNEDVWGGTPVPYLRSKSCTCGYTSHNAHGVGMCQYGAQAMATAGSAWESILTYYYTNATVDKPSITLGTLKGVIYFGNDNANLNNRITGAVVKLNTGEQVVSGENGLYSFDLVPGQYTVTATKSGFSSNSLIRDVTAGTTIWGSIQLTQATGIPGDIIPKVSIYPNPTKEYITIESDGTSQVALYDLTGRELLRTTITGKTDMPLTRYAPGIYILHIKGNGYSIKEKVIIVE